MFFRLGFQLLILNVKASWVPRLTRNKGIMFKIFESYCNQLNLKVNYVLHFSDKKRTKYTENIGNLPIFYQQMLCSFNE